MKFRKKPVVVEAVQFRYWVNHYGRWEAVEYIEGVRGAKTLLEKIKDLWKGFPHYYCDTLEGTLVVRNCDWILKGVNGEFYPCKNDIFKKTYEKVEEIRE